MMESILNCLKSGQIQFRFDRFFVPDNAGFRGFAKILM